MDGEEERPTWRADEAKERAMARDPRYAEMAHWLVEAQQAERAMAQAKDDGARWLQRARLARDAGRDELVDEAATRARAAHESYTRAKARYEEAQLNRRSVLAQRPDIGARERAFADALLEVFRELGVDPAAGELDTLVAEHDLQARLDTMRTDAGFEEDVDALALLRARMNDDATDPS